jgi:predicted MFS family arabinose efflux permease
MYVNSTYLHTIFLQGVVSVFYIIGSILALAVVVINTHSIHRFGNYKTTLYLLTLEAAAICMLAFSTNSLTITLGFLFYMALTIALYLNLDIFLKNTSSPEHVGAVRGTFLTLNNISWLIGPALAGFILTDNNWHHVYLASLLMLLPCFIILLQQLRTLEEPAYNQPPAILAGWQHLKKDPDVYTIFKANFLLQLLYAWMVIYLPIYLFENIGFTLTQIGIMLSLVLIAFPLLEIPLGKMADERLGEQEILTLGFIVIVLATSLLPFIQIPNIVLWTGVLFLTRIGAAMVEVMSETYFFKKVDSHSTDILGFFRTTRALAYLAAPLAAVIFLSFFSLRWLWLGLSIFMILGIMYARRIHDTL